MNPPDEINPAEGLAESETQNRLYAHRQEHVVHAASENTLKAYATDWAHFSRWCRLKGATPLPPSPGLIGLYLADLTAITGTGAALSASSIDRRLSGIAWSYKQRGFSLDRKDRHIATVLGKIKREHAKPPTQKEAILPGDILAMVATLGFDLRGLRDRAILLLGYAGGWLDIQDNGLLLILNAKSGPREIEIERRSSDQSCPVHALEQWLHFAKINSGPIFVRTSRDGKRALEARLNDKHVVRLIKQTVLNANIRADLPEKDRLALFSGHSLRAAGLAGRTSG